MIAGPLEENQQRFLAEYEKRCKSNLDESATSICRALDIDLSDYNRWQTPGIFVERFKELDLRILREQESAPDAFTVLNVPETPVSEPAKPQQSDAIPYDKIRKALPLLCDAKGWGREELGKRIGVSKQTLLFFENGTNKTLKNVDRLPQAFECNNFEEMLKKAEEIWALKVYGISRIVQKIRQLHGLKSTDLGEKIGILRQGIYKIESGRLHGFHYVVDIQKALGYPTLTAMLEAVKQYEAAKAPSSSAVAGGDSDGTKWRAEEYKRASTDWSSAREK